MKESEIVAELPAGSGFGLISDTKFVDVSPVTVSNSVRVLPVFVRL